MQKITPCLWFDGQAEQAAEFYVSLFEQAAIQRVDRFGPAGPGPEGSALMVAFRLAGQDYLALNGGPEFAFTPAVSFYVRCADQAEVDRLWERLTEGGGEPGQCGWLKDRFGVSWQIVPQDLERLLADPDPARVERTFRALLGMTKLEADALERAAEGG